MLRDASAAKFRRRIRDSLLLALLGVQFLTGPGALVVWLVVALVISFASRAGRSSRSVVGGVVLLIAVGWGLYLTMVVVLPVITAFSIGSIVSVSGFALSDLALASLPVTLMFAVLAADKYAVSWLVHTCFRRSRFLVHGGESPAELERFLRQPRGGAYEANLRRVAEAEHATARSREADIVLHRGFSPFIGAGDVLATQAIAVSLEQAATGDDTAAGNRRADQGSGARIDVLELHDRVSRALDELRTASSLAPGERLAGLSVREQVLVSAEQLVRHQGTRLQQAVLPFLDRPPHHSFEASEARCIARDPVEWGRYYRCYRLETWERDLTLSCYLHFGTDQRVMYVERVHCLVMPLRADIRRIDEPLRPAAPFFEAVAELATLPTSVIRRFRNVFVGESPTYQGPNEVIPGRYGAGRSLRELASAREFPSFFQNIDVVRYAQVVDKVILRAIGSYLEDKGYSVVEFQAQFPQTINDFRGSSFTNSAVGPNSRTSNAGNNGRSAGDNG